MLHTAEAIAIAQSRRQSTDEFFDDVYARLETDSPSVEGTIWEACIGWTNPDDMPTLGYILATASLCLAIRLDISAAAV